MQSSGVLEFICIDVQIKPYIGVTVRIKCVTYFEAQNS